MRRTIFLLVLLWCVPLPAASLPSGSWTLDPDGSSVSFTVTKLKTTVVEGRFRDFSGEMRFDARHPQQSSLSWSVRVESIETGATQRDRNLRGPGFLDAARFPNLTFVATRFQPLPDGRVRIGGTITIHGQQRPLTVDARPVSADPERPVFETRFHLDRLDFGVDGESILAHAISRNISVHLVAAGRMR